MSVTAPSIVRTLQIAGDGLPDRKVRVVFPIVPEEFFVKAETQPVAKSATDRASGCLMV